MASSDSVIAKEVAKKLKKYLDIQRREQGFDLSDPFHPIREPKKKVKVRYNNFFDDEDIKKQVLTPTKRLENEIGRIKFSKNLASVKEVETRVNMERNMAQHVSPSYVVSPYQQRPSHVSIASLLTKKKKKRRVISAGRLGRGQKINRRGPPEKITPDERERIVNLTTKLLVATESVALPSNRKQSRSSQTRAGELPIVSKAGRRLDLRPYSAPLDDSGKLSPLPQSVKKGRIKSAQDRSPNEAVRSDDLDYRRLRGASTNSDYSLGSSYLEQINNTTTTKDGYTEIVQDIDDDDFRLFQSPELTSSVTNTSSLFNPDELKLFNDNFTQTNQTASTQTIKHTDDNRFSEESSFNGEDEFWKDQVADKDYSVDSEKLEDMSTQTRRKNTEKKVITYEVYVVTGNKLGSSTNANVKINIFGEYGNTGERQLLKSKSSKLPFQRNQVDIFHLDTMFLGQLVNIRIGHDSSSVGDGWYLEKIVIKEGAKATRAFSFQCKRWLSAKEDDGQIVRDLPLTAQIKEFEVPIPTVRKSSSSDRVKKQSSPRKTLPEKNSLSSSSPVPTQQQSTKKPVAKNREYFDKNEKSDSDVSSSVAKLPSIKRKTKSMTRVKSVTSTSTSSSDSETERVNVKPRKPRMKPKTSDSSTDPVVEKPKANISGLINKVNIVEKDEKTSSKLKLNSQDNHQEKGKISSDEKKATPPSTTTTTHTEPATHTEPTKTNSKLNYSLSSDSSSSDTSSSDSESSEEKNNTTTNEPQIVKKASSKVKKQTETNKDDEDDDDDEKIEFSNKVTEKKYSETLDEDKYMAGFIAGIKANKTKEEEKIKRESQEKLEFEEKLKQGTTVHQACEDGDLDRLKELVSLVPELKNKADERGWAPIHICAAFGHLDLVKWLSVSGVILVEETPTGYTAIHLAAMNGHVNCIMILAAMGCPISSRTVDGLTPLHLASMSGHIECLKWLLSNRAKVDVKDKNDRTPLDLAEEYQHGECIKLLKIMNKELSRKDSILKVLRDPNALRRNSVTADQQRTKAGDSGVGADDDEDEEWKSDAEEDGDVIGRGGDDRPQVTRRISLQGRKMSTHGKVVPKPQAGKMQRRVSKADMKHNTELVEKKKAYEEQHHKQEKRRISFLDSIRMDVDDNDV